MSEKYLEHYGVKRRSGRYPWGSGQNPKQRENKRSHSTLNDVIDRSYTRNIERLGKSERDNALLIPSTTSKARTSALLDAAKASLKKGWDVELVENQSFRDISEAINYGVISYKNKKTVIIPYEPKGYGPKNENWIDLATHTWTKLTPEDKERIKKRNRLGTGDGTTMKLSKDKEWIGREVEIPIMVPFSRDDESKNVRKSLEHYGIKRRSGRYPWGSGANPKQREGTKKVNLSKMSKEERHEALLKTSKASAIYKYRKELSDKELKMVVERIENRVNMERRLKALSDREKNKNIEAANKAINKVLKYDETALKVGQHVSRWYDLVNSNAGKAIQKAVDKKAKESKKKKDK